MPTQDRILVVGDYAEIGGLLRDSYRFAGWTLDVATRNHTAPDGVVVALSGTECRLLRVFLDQPNRVLTQDQLIDLTLSRDAALFDRAIVVQVGRLRHRRRRVPRKSSRRARLTRCRRGSLPISATAPGCWPRCRTT